MFVIFTAEKLVASQLKIPVDENIQPVSYFLYRIPCHLRGTTDEKLGITEEVNSSSQWISPIVVISKGKKNI